jgi:hypothetical protein
MHHLHGSSFMNDQMLPLTVATEVARKKCQKHHSVIYWIRYMTSGGIEKSSPCSSSYRPVNHFANDRIHSFRQITSTINVQNDRE